MTPLAAATAPAAGGSIFSLLIFALPVVVLIWLMMSQRKRAKAVTEAQAELVVGQDVMLAAGLYGTIAHLDGEMVHLQIADGVIVRVNRRSILPPSQATV